MVHKLGHYGFVVNDWDREIRWYTDNFNFVPSDVQYEPNNEDLDVIAFMHLDLGERFSDHHSLFLSRAPPGVADRMHHTSFEVEDFDTQLLGHDWLWSKGYTSVWGVGRHILGSQIFDYWRDPTGYTIEHYADGDLVNVNTGTKRSRAGPLSVWGPEMSHLMFEDGTKPKDASTAIGP
jgi:catechol 2,3-dioxygenase-like lactoylglutathione lyase family enzyme